MNKKDVTRLFKMVKLKAKKHSPEILTGLGIAGMITTTVLAVKATPKALQLIEEAEKEKAHVYNEQHPDKDIQAASLRLSTPEIVKATWKQYIPAVALGGASVACLIGANSVHTRRHAALYSAYKLTETAYTEYKDKVEEVVSDKKVTEIKKKLAEDKVKKVHEETKDTPSVVVAGDGDIWFIDAMSNQRFLSTKNKLDAAANKLNKDMRTDMYISLSQFYDEVGGGLKHTGNSDTIGWRIDADYIDVVTSETIEMDGRIYVVMDFRVRPEYGYDIMY